MTEKVLQIGDWEFGKNGIATLIYNFNLNLDTKKVIFDYIVTNEVRESFYKKTIESKKGKIYELKIDKTGIKRKLILFFKLIKFLKNNKYKIVHINESTAHSMLYYSFICKISGVKKIILHSHSSGLDSNKRKVKLIMHNLSKILLPLFAHEFLACSETAAKWMYKKKYLSKIEIVKNGIDVEKFKFNFFKRKELREKMKIENIFVLGHVGRISYTKNHRFLIELFNEVKKIIPNSKLLLIGTGPLEKEMKEITKNLKLEKDILFLGVKNNVEDYLQIMDLFLLPSHFEGLPVVGIEAQSSGLTCFFSKNISKEVKVLNSCKFLPLNNSKKWLKEIKKEKDNYSDVKRKYSFLEVRKNGYDVKDCVEKLTKLYMKLGEE